MKSNTPHNQTSDAESTPAQAAPHWSHLSDIGLQRRVMVYAFIGLTSLAAIFAFVALDAVDKSSDAILRERLNLATTVAHTVDQTIISSQSLVLRTAGDLNTTHNKVGDLTDHETVMLESLGKSLADFNSGEPPESVFLFDKAGKMIWESRSTPSEKNFALDPETLVDATRPSILSNGDIDFAILIGSRIEGNTDLAYLGAVISPSQQLLAVSDQADEEIGNYQMELLDSKGQIIAESTGGSSNNGSRHIEVIGTLVVNQSEGVQKHAPGDGNDAGVDHIVAYAPLTSVPWGVVLEQREDAALALPNNLRRRVLIIAAVGLAIGITMAWVTSRMVVLPLSRLNERAKRIAQGDLTGSIEKEGQDEVRRLAESFETMRSRLETSQRELAEWSTELEKRVKQRTGQLEQRDKERDVLLNKVISAQEDERTRIARDLHDQIGQTLTGLVMQIGGAQARLANDPETVKEQLITLGESASGAVEEVRRMMSDLRPSILDDMGLESAVGWYTETHLERQGITVVLDLQREKVPLSPNVEISAFRVCQEAITNVIKHANAKRVHISLDYNNGSLNGTIQDDGSGFELSTTQPGADGGWAVGILGMTERVNLLGGSLTIESNPDSGTAVKFEIPLGGTAQDE
jgi:signal transduction histidine kinase